MCTRNHSRRAWRILTPGGFRAHSVTDQCHRRLRSFYVSGWVTVAHSLLGPVLAELVGGIAMSKIHLERAAVVFGIVLMAACAQPSTDRPPATGRDAPLPPAVETAQTPEQRLAAIKTARAEEAEYAKRLAAVVQAEARNDAWASQKEQDLKRSYASLAKPGQALKSVECRTTKCDVQFEVATKELPDTSAGPIAAVNEWIAASQPCAYTLVAGEVLAQPAAVVRIFLDCAQPSPTDKRP